MPSRSIVLRLLSLAALAACSDLPPPPIGQLRLGLSSGIGEERYRLAQASFAISGAAELSLGSEEDPDSDTIQRALPQGDYDVRLLEGWQLTRVGEAGAVRVSAELASANPLPFSIRAGELTTVVFQFRTGGSEAPAGGAASDGQVRIEIEVDGQGAPDVIISELMKNPDILPDADGEWIELYNAGSAAVDLGGCTLARDDQDISFDGSLPLEPGAYLTLANSEAPGFTPDILYGGLTLPNSGLFNLRLACGGQTLDDVQVDPAEPPQRAGRSLSLSASAIRGARNGPGSWCEGASSYNGDFGTPGKANPDCVP